MHRKRTKLWVLFFAIFLADLISKWATVTFLPLMNSYAFYPYGGIGVFHHVLGIEFSLVHTTNTGAAWGWLQEFQIPLLILRVAIIVGLLIFLWKFNKNPRLEYPLTAILAGAVGNVADVYFYGPVIDMFYFNLWGYPFPVFNVADTAISLGVFGLLIDALFFKHHARAK